METKIIRDMEQCYLVLQADKEAGFQQKMVLQNDIPNLLVVEQRKIDSEYQYYYSITDKICLNQYYAKKKVTSEDIQFLFCTIIQIIQKCHEFLLAPDNFILQEDTIFFSIDGTKLYLCFHELHQVAVREQMVKLAELFMELIDYKEEQAIILTYGLYKVLRDEGCNFNKVEETILKYGERKQMITHIDKEFNEVLQENVNQSIDIGITSFENEQKAKKVAQVIGIIISILYIVIIVRTRLIFYHHTCQIHVGNLILSTIVLLIINLLNYRVVSYVVNNILIARNKISYLSEDYDGQETVVIANCTLSYVLRREGGIEQLRVDAFPFVLGSGREGVSGVLQHTGVSKRHAIIEQKGDKIQIMDLNSTNGTFLNGELLSPMEPNTLKAGDKITLANITYQFIKL